MRLRDRGLRELISFCGDAEGFPGSVRQRAQQKISLSAMTLSHELARVVLAEQLYRVFAILAGSPLSQIRLLVYKHNYHVYSHFAGR